MPTSFYALLLKARHVSEKPGGRPPSRARRLREAVRRRRQRLDGVVISTATQLLPLVALLDALQPQLAQESVFRVRRKKLRAHWAIAYAELQAEHPRHRVLAHAFQVLTELVRDETRDISPEEWRQAAKELALATLKNAPALLSAAQQMQRLA